MCILEILSPLLYNNNNDNNNELMKKLNNFIKTTNLTQYKIKLNNV